MHQLPEISSLLNSRGIRPTRHRVSIAAHVLSKHRHFTADELFDWTQTENMGISRATVYNTLNEFVGAGLLRSFQTANTSSLVFDSNLTNHFHIYDTEKNTFVDLDASAIQIRPELLANYEIEQVEVVIKARKKTVS